MAQEGNSKRRNAQKKAQNQEAESWLAYQQIVLARKERFLLSISDGSRMIDFGRIYVNP